MNVVNRKGETVRTYEDLFHARDAAQELANLTGYPYRVQCGGFTLATCQPSNAPVTTRTK